MPSLDMTEHMTRPSTAKFCTDIQTPLRDRVALLPGSRDRKNHPVIFFPSTETVANSDDLKNILQYFNAVTADDCKKDGFLFIIGTKKGTTKQSVKPILRSIHDFFPGHVAAVYVIKQDNFLDKLKFNSSSNKYKFAVHEVSIENLTSFIDSNQLLKEFKGNLYYDHDEWIELRKDIERVVQRLSDCLRDCDFLNSMLQNKRHAEDQGWPSGAGAYDELENRLNAIDPMECEREIQIVQQRIMSSADEGYSSAATLKTPNPDLAAVIPHLIRLGKTVFASKNELARRCNESRREEDKWRQFNILEKDVQTFKDWINSNKKMVELRFTMIGSNLEELQQLIHENDGLVNSTENNRVNLERIYAAGRTMLEDGAVAKGKTEAMLKDLEHCWNYFTTKLDQRGNLLTHALEFRVKTDQFFYVLPQWEGTLAAFAGDVTDRTGAELQEDVNMFDQLGKEIDIVYTEAFNETNKLSEYMKMYFGQEKVGRTESFLHVLEVTKKLAKGKREIQILYEEKKEKHYFKCSFRTFLDESKSVMDWLIKHGEPFLKKRTEIGDSMERSKQLSDQHNKFQLVASNTYRNADQLFQVGKRLQSNPEYNIEEVGQRIQELHSMIDGFSNRMQQRSELLKLSHMFHLHYNEIMKWYDELTNRTRLCETVPKDPDDADRLIDKILRENDATSSAFNTVMSESAQLISHLRQQREMLGSDVAPSLNHIDLMTTQIKTRHTTEMEREPYQRNCVLVAKNVSVHLADCDNICQSIISWQKDLQGLLNVGGYTPNQFESLIASHKENIRQVKEVSIESEVKFSELLKAITNDNLNLIDIDGRPFKDVLIEQSRQFQTFGNSVLRFADEVTNKLSISRGINELLVETGELNRDLSRFQQEFDKMLVTIPSDTRDAIRRESEFVNLRKQYDYLKKKMGDIRMISEECAEACANDKQQRTQIMRTHNALVKKVEDCDVAESKIYKLVSYARNYYDASDKMKPIIRNYMKSHDQTDYCVGCPKNDATSLTAYLAEQITHNHKKKEMFLQSCVFAQRMTDAFIKAIDRGSLDKYKAKETINAIIKEKNKVKVEQTQVLQVLSEKLKKIEQCQTAVFLRKATEDVLNWLYHDDQVRSFKNEQKSVTELRRMSRNGIEKEMQAVYEFKLILKKQRSKASEICRHAVSFVKDSPESVHLMEVQGYEQKIREDFKKFSEYFLERERLVSSVLNGGESGVAERLSDCTLEDKMEQQIGPNVDHKMRLPMQELIEGEKKYSAVLEMGVKHYLAGYRRAEEAGSLDNTTLKDKERAIFGNFVQILDFNYKFLKDVEAYTDNPVDVAFAFVNNIDRMRELYTEYIVNLQQNCKFVASAEVKTFFHRIRNNDPAIIMYEKETTAQMNLDSILMSPIQRPFKYKALLDRLIQLSPYEIKEIKEMAETIEDIANHANDKIKLYSLQDYTKYAKVDFVMAGVFNVKDPKKIVKREKEYQVFLFEDSIILTKIEKFKLETTEKEKFEYAERYIFKEEIKLKDINVVEHVDGSTNKFGLRKSGKETSNEDTTVFKGDNDKIREKWVKKLRALKMATLHSDAKKSNMSLDQMSTPTGSNRNSRASRDSCDLSHTTTTSGLTEDTASMSSQNDNNNKAGFEFKSFRLSQWQEDKP